MQTYLQIIKDTSLSSELNFCTLFDSNYLTRGLALYNSLIRREPDARLFVFAFDESCAKVLKELKLKNVTVITLQEFEDKELLEVKPTRSKAEYCWTCTPSIILYCLKNFPITNCTYVDADMFFFSSPRALVEELGADFSVSISEHRYTPEFDQTKTSGIYCVQFMTFKNNETGLNIVNWWRDRCLEWCYNRAEDGKFGDQKYLDDWTTRFSGVKVLENLGCGVAPWNVQQYQVSKKSDIPFIGYKADTFPIVFYHFHGFRFLKDKILLTDYSLTKNARECIYRPYINELQKINAELSSWEKDFNGTISWSFKQRITAKVKSLLKSTPVFSPRKF